MAAGEAAFMALAYLNGEDIGGGDDRTPAGKSITISGLNDFIGKRLNVNVSLAGGGNNIAWGNVTIESDSEMVTLYLENDEVPLNNGEYQIYVSIYEQRPNGADVSFYQAYDNKDITGENTPIALDDFPDGNTAIPSGINVTVTGLSAYSDISLSITVSEAGMSDSYIASGYVDNSAGDPATVQLSHSKGTELKTDITYRISVYIFSKNDGGNLLFNGSKLGKLSVNTIALGSFPYLTITDLDEYNGRYLGIAVYEMGEPVRQIAYGYVDSITGTTATVQLGVLNTSTTEPVTGTDYLISVQIRSSPSDWDNHYSGSYTGPINTEVALSSFTSPDAE
jgi:hypothetical protein